MRRPGRSPAAARLLAPALLATFAPLVNAQDPVTPVELSLVPRSQATGLLIPVRTRPLEGDGQGRVQYVYGASTILAEIRSAGIVVDRNLDGRIDGSEEQPLTKGQVELTAQVELSGRQQQARVILSVEPLSTSGDAAGFTLQLQADSVAKGMYDDHGIYVADHNVNGDFLDRGDRISFIPNGKEPPRSAIGQPLRSKVVIANHLIGVEVRPQRSLFFRLLHCGAWVNPLPQGNCVNGGLDLVRQNRDLILPIDGAGLIPVQGSTYTLERPWLVAKAGTKPEAGFRRLGPCQHHPRPSLVRRILQAAEPAAPNLNATGETNLLFGPYPGLTLDVGLALVEKRLVCFRLRVLGCLGEEYGLDQVMVDAPDLTTPPRGGSVVRTKAVLKTGGVSSDWFSLKSQQDWERPGFNPTLPITSNPTPADTISIVYGGSDIPKLSASFIKTLPEVANQPMTAGIILLAAEGWWRDGDTVKALSLARKAQTLTPSEPLIDAWLARFFLTVERHRDLANAKTLALKAVASTKSQDADCLEILAQAQRAEGASQEAVITLAKARVLRDKAFDDLE